MRLLRKVLLGILLVIAIAAGYVLVKARSYVVPVVATLTRRVAAVDLYGYGSANLEDIRARLPVKVGDFSARLHFGQGRNAAFEQATGHTPVYVTPVCCDERGREWVFVGLGGGEVPLSPEPTAAEKLSQPLLNLYDEFFLGLMAAIGRGNAAEERTTGYALSKDPELRAIQLRLREAALRHEDELYTIATRSRDATSRAAAVHLLGYARRSRRQAATLGTAARDPDESVRNNATRALGVLLEAFPEDSKGLDLDNLLHLMNSPNWTDRNKASMVLERVSRTRDRAVLDRMNAESRGALVEMARWTSPHRVPAVQILARIGGMDESTLIDGMQRGRYDEILESALRAK